MLSEEKQAVVFTIVVVGAILKTAPLTKTLVPAMTLVTIVMELIDTGTGGNVGQEALVF
jgi:hypothetical protein